MPPPLAPVPDSRADPPVPSSVSPFTLPARRSRPDGAPDASSDRPISPVSNAKTLPNLALCRAKNSGFANYADFADCLVDSPSECRHALRFGMRRFCRHPDRVGIVTRSAPQPTSAME